MSSKLFNYLEGTQNEKEKEAFEKKISENENLKETVELYNEIDDFAEQYDELAEIKQRVKKLHNNYEKQQQTRSRASIWIRQGSIAASILIVVGVVGYFTVFNQTPNSVYQRNYVAWQPKNVTRGQSIQNNFTKWVAVYSNGQYEQVISAFPFLPKDYKLQPQVVLMHSSALMQQEKFSEALSQLMAFDLSNYSFFVDDFNWYKGLCYIRLGEIDRAKSTFEILLESKKYKDQAQDVITKL